MLPARVFPEPLYVNVYDEPRPPTASYGNWPLLVTLPLKVKLALFPQLKPPPLRTSRSPSVTVKPEFTFNLPPLVTIINPVVRLSLMVIVAPLVMMAVSALVGTTPPAQAAVELQLLAVAVLQMVAA